jgi:hypothetical protein
VVTPKTGKPRGRRRLDFLQDPDRFPIALAFALRTLGNSENDAFRSVAALAFGWKDCAKEVAPRRKPGRGAIPGGLLVSYERAAYSGAATTTLIGKATTLRHKGARLERDPRAMAWLLNMQAAFALALQAAPSSERCATRILELGQLVVAHKLSEDQLLNVLSGELPDLFTNDPAQG